MNIWSDLFRAIQPTTGGVRTKKQTPHAKMPASSQHTSDTAATAGVAGLMGTAAVGLLRWVQKNVQTTIRNGEMNDYQCTNHFLSTSIIALFVETHIKKHVNPISPCMTTHTWTLPEDELLVRLVNVHETPRGIWKKIAANFTGKTARQCSVRWDELCPVKSAKSDLRRLDERFLKRASAAEELASTMIINDNDRCFMGNLVRRALQRHYCHAHTKLQQIKLKILCQLVQRISKEHVLEFMKGGHAIVHDNGQFYHRVRATEGSHPRTSSHYPDCKTMPHYGLTLRVGLTTVHILAGVTKQNKEVVTWTQLESSPMPHLFRLRHGEGLVRNLQGLLSHARDYIAHRRTKKQYGPLGASTYSEKGEHPRIIHIH
jgi:hypothetical protein